MRPAVVVGVLVAVMNPAFAADVDLAIGFCKKTDRPNVFIAWRNSQRVLEVEVEVKNLAEEQAVGALVLSILDEEGRLLATTMGNGGYPQKVTLPPRSKGGDEGKIVQIKGSLDLNLLIDRLDRANVRYMIKASVLPESKDANLVNNHAVKTFNIPSRLKAGAKHYREFTFRNTKNEPLEVVWKTECSELPSGWSVEVDPKPGTTSTVRPGEMVHGSICLSTLKDLVEGQHVDVRVGCFNARGESQAEEYQFEWFAVYDNTPPEMTGMSYKVDPETGILEAASTVNDKHSMIKEASGVRVEYSTDGGITFSSRVMAYKAGNFVGPTSFKADLGPFAPGTQVTMRVVAEDIAGNRAERRFDPISIPRQAKK